jgi:hypothetical protein
VPTGKAIFVIFFSNSLLKSLLKMRCRILPAGGMGVSPSFKKSPKIGDIGS